MFQYKASASGSKIPVNTLLTGVAPHTLMKWVLPNLTEKAALSMAKVKAAYGKPLPYSYQLLL